MAAAEGAEQVLVGLAALGPVVVVVDIAVAGRPTAAGDPAVTVAGAYVVLERGRRAVPRAADLEQLPGGRIGQQPAPGAGRIGRDLTGDAAGIQPWPASSAGRSVAPSRLLAGTVTWTSTVR